MPHINDIMSQFTPPREQDPEELVAYSGYAPADNAVPQPQEAVTRAEVINFGQDILQSVEQLLKRSDAQRNNLGNSERAQLALNILHNAGFGSDELRKLAIGILKEALGGSQEQIAQPNGVGTLPAGYAESTCPDFVEGAPADPDTDPSLADEASSNT